MRYSWEMQNRMGEELSARQQQAFSGLETLFVVCDRFSHSIRTHLGVSMGVVDDLLKGIALGADDFRDAQHALRAILGTLNAVRELTNKPCYSPQLMSLAELIKLIRSTIGDLGGELRISLPATDAPRIDVLLDPKLFCRSIQALSSFVSMSERRQAKREGRPVESISILLEFFFEKMTTIPRETKVLRVTFGRERERARETAPKKDLRELASLDQSPEALGLLFCLEVFHLHNGTIECDVTDTGNPLFIGKIPLPQP